MGAAVPVIYDSRTPGIAEINEPERLWGGMMFQGVLSTVFILIGCGGFYIAMRKVQQKSLAAALPEHLAGAGLPNH